MKQLLSCNTIGLFTTDNTNMVDFYTEIMGFETNWNGFNLDDNHNKTTTSPRHAIVGMCLFMTY